MLAFAFATIVSVDVCECSIIITFVARVSLSIEDDVFAIVVPVISSCLAFKSLQFQVLRVGIDICIGNCSCCFKVVCLFPPG